MRPADWLLPPLCLPWPRLVSLSAEGNGHYMGHGHGHGREAVCLASATPLAHRLVLSLHLSRCSSLLPFRLLHSCLLPSRAFPAAVIPDLASPSGTRARIEAFSLWSLSEYLPSPSNREPALDVYLHSNVLRGCPGAPADTRRTHSRDLDDANQRHPISTLGQLLATLISPSFSVSCRHLCFPPRARGVEPSRRRQTSEYFRLSSVANNRSFDNKLLACCTRPAFQLFSRSFLWEHDTISSSVFCVPLFSTRLDVLFDCRSSNPTTLARGRTIKDIRDDDSSSPKPNPQRHVLGRSLISV
ncbi:hypothetical protein EDB81DRAFT_186222 [Dactylonectria macrodidyma]|uniref:Uncharacterized protein n=1 Tax=Dactylonectria macrodidyma TaxID=307937 RepID=A0A9P9FP72_9HYPO|nr:hypothetical protein EDB81DRAFT_186222 [Dactylonectria macrodidyma]